jgi:hypothetical protein
MKLHLLAIGLPLCTGGLPALACAACQLRRRD